MKTTCLKVRPFSYKLNADDDFIFDVFDNYYDDEDMHK